MKISREARQIAKKLFGLCRSEGHLDEARVLESIDWLKTERPRHYIEILSHFARLVTAEVEAHTASVTSAQPVQDKNAFIKELKEKFGDRIKVTFETNPDLIAGVRVQVGSNVWDDSVAGRLKKIEEVLK
jgi:F-type H+-transporting ATPase subunit delta